jgi:hypothetical protein
MVLTLTLFLKGDGYAGKETKQYQAASSRSVNGKGDVGEEGDPDRPPVPRFVAAELPFFFEGVDPRGAIGPTEPQRTQTHMGECV